MKNILKIFIVCLMFTACETKKDENNFTIVTEGGEVSYKLDKAQELDELIKGLMGVESLPENGGMIFDLSKIEGAAMWMKDTKISLDMIFADDEGNIVYIYENAKPMSEDIIESPVPFDYVVELNGGQVAKNKVKIGDKLKHEFFKNFETK